MVDRDKEIRRFERAAKQRLATAAFLLEHQYYLDAIYLAGYAVECSLKALILRRTARNEFLAVYEQLTAVGSKGHNFEYLKAVLKTRLVARRETDRSALAARTGYLQEVGSWSTDLRYQAGAGHPHDAERFFRAARA